MAADTPLTRLISRGKDRADLASLGIETVEDALRWFPRTYIIPGEVTPLAELEIDSTAVVSAEVVRADSRRTSRNGTITTVVLSDGVREIEAPFFNQPWLADRLRPGRHVALTGKVGLFRGQVLQLRSPKWLNPTGEESLDEEDLSTPIPVYRANSRIATTRLQRLIRVLLDTAAPEAFADPIPEDVRAQHGLPDLRTALTWMHRPADEHEPEQAQERWRFEEAFALQAELLSRKAQAGRSSAKPLHGGAGHALADFDAALPFELTRSQRIAAQEISLDLAEPAPMNRLLHGDVGSGKTLVALRAMLQAVDSGAQAALLAPTEVLAAQHHRSLTAQLGSFAAESSLFGGADGVRIALLTGSLAAKARKALLLELASGQIDIVVGTHALLSDTTMFAALGLVVVDEQHRFGVRQREALRAKGPDGTTPHTLVMTATPIPRTVAMTVFGDLDVTRLTDQPGGPRQITTHAVSLAEHPRWIGRVWQVLAERVAAGEQAFVVTSRIESQEATVDEEGVRIGPVVGVEEMVERLSREPALEGVRLGMLHGRMEAADKDARMTEFAAGAFDVLVATTVIEVGIDVPNARTIVICDADRFGVAQLHQLRGRVGRDGSPATCFLITTADADSPSMERLRTVAGTLDGFALADYDIGRRREGDVLGRSQWGSASSLRYLSVLRDETVIFAARTAAEAVVAEDPALTGHPVLTAYIASILAGVDEDFSEAG